MDRRSFLGRAALGAACAALAGRASAQVQRPNVVLIFADDQGSVDINCYGAKDLITPNLDALASRGVRFTQFYVGSAVCSPSRAALLTGRYPHRAGVPGSVGRGSGMPPEEITLAEMFKGAGYHTALFGKWHLGTDAERSPTSQGFDEFLGHKEGCIDNFSHFFYWNGPNRHDLWRGNTEIFEDGTHFSEIILRETSRFMDENRAHPFFMYLPFNIPHYPLQPDVEYRKMYAHLEHPRSDYAALVTHLDAAVGKIVDHIDSLGLRENTIILYISDHGHSVEERTFFGGGSAGPYRGAKGSLFEGGIRVPCIASWPGHFPEGTVRDQMVVSMDWFPTLAKLCGLTLSDRKLDGKDISDVLASEDASSPHDWLHWQLGDQWAVRQGDWKLVMNPRDLGGPEPTEEIKLFLANLADDIGESKNLAGEQPDVVEALTKLHETWEADLG
jgi:arylsulfatase A-like enzyme